MSVFKRASKSQSRLRMALIGPSGSGKTYTALALASELATQLGSGRVAVIDTEHGSAAKYAPPSSRANAPQPGEYVFDCIELGNFDPRNYIEMIQAAEAERYDALIIDSLSHAWSGKGGALELVDSATKRSKSGNSFTAWRDVTPLHNALVEAIIGSTCHIFATMRAKTEYAMETDSRTGKLVPRKVGLAPVQREGMDYEFDVVADMDVDHNLIVGKTRYHALDGVVLNRPGAALARTLAAWLSDGSSVAPSVPESPVPAAPAPAAQTPQTKRSEGSAYDLCTEEQQKQLVTLIAQLNLTEYQVRSALARRGVSRLEQLNQIDAMEIIRKLEFEISRIQFINTFPDCATSTSAVRSSTSSALVAGHDGHDGHDGQTVNPGASDSKTNESDSESNGYESETCQSESDAANNFVVPETVRPIRGENATGQTATFTTTH